MPIVAIAELTIGEFGRIEMLRLGFPPCMAFERTFILFMRTNRTNVGCIRATILNRSSMHDCDLRIGAFTSRFY